MGKSNQTSEHLSRELMIKYINILMRLFRLGKGHNKVNILSFFIDDYIKSIVKIWLYYIPNITLMFHVFVGKCAFTIS